MPTIQPRVGFGRCTDFTIDTLNNTGAIECDGTTPCVVAMVIEAVVYNGVEPMTYNWASDDGDDHGLHTERNYRLDVTGSNEIKVVNVSLTVTDANETKNITVPLSITFGTP